MSVRLGKLVRCEKWPELDGYIRYNVTSASAKWRELSPMVLGPIHVRDVDGIHVSSNIENAWQFSKVYPNELSEDDTITKSYFTARTKGFNDGKAHRHKFKKVGGVRPVPKFLYWNGKRYDYFSSRVNVYIPMYIHMVTQTAEYTELKKMVANGTKLLLVGYDGYDYVAEGKTLRDCLLDLSRPFGHEHVLAGLLTDNHVWDEFKTTSIHDIIDTKVVLDTVVKATVSKSSAPKCEAKYKSGPNKGTQCTNSGIHDVGGHFFCGRHK